MKIQKQPNPYSCLATAIAIAADIDIENMIRELGHDGSEIIFPNAPEPSNHRGFHPQEFPRILRRRSLAMMEMSNFLTIGSPFSSIPYTIQRYQNQATWIHEELDYYFRRFPCVLCGTLDNNKRHAVVMDPLSRSIFDPNGSLSEIKVVEIEICLAIIPYIV